MFQDNDGVWIQRRHLHLLPSVLGGDRKKHNACWSNLSSDGMLGNDSVVTSTGSIDPVCQISTLLWFYPVRWDTEDVPRQPEQADVPDSTCRTNGLQGFFQNGTCSPAFKSDTCFVSHYISLHHPNDVPLGWWLFVFTKDQRLGFSFGRLIRRLLRWQQ